MHCCMHLRAHKQTEGSSSGSQSSSSENSMSTSCGAALNKFSAAPKEDRKLRCNCPTSAHEPNAVDVSEASSHRQSCVAQRVLQNMRFTQSVFQHPRLQAKPHWIFAGPFEVFSSSLCQEPQHDRRAQSDSKR